MNEHDIKVAKKRYKKIFKVPVAAPLIDGVGELVDVLEEMHEQ